MALSLTKPLKEVRHFLTSKCVRILLAYRRNCAASTSPGQLILPESFKLFPLYTLAMNKNKAIKGGNVTSDVRTLYMRNLRSLSVANTMALLYPRMIALHRMSEADGFPIKVPDGEGNEVDGARIRTPPLMRPSYLRMEAHGAYLVENGEICLLWIGAEANPRLLEDLYGVESLDALDPRMVSVKPTEGGENVRADRRIASALSDHASQAAYQALAAGAQHRGKLRSAAMQGRAASADRTTESRWQ